jgi:hypothetical protein
VPTPTVIHTRAGRAEVLRLLGSLGAVLAGTRGAPAGAGAAAGAVPVRLGLAALGFLHEAFAVKGAGGTDAAGLRWAPLRPATVAYSRNHPGLPGKRRRAPYRPSYALSKGQRERWWRFYREGLARYAGDKAHAAAAAWVRLTAAGRNPTLMERYGSAPVKILHATGALESSLKPGARADAAGQSPPRVKYQVFRPGPGRVTIGTGRPWARTHHLGVPGRIPRRALWPEPARWPAAWGRELLGQAREGAVGVIAAALGA